MSTEKVCSFDGCGRDTYSLGFCSGHYQQNYRGRRLTPLGTRLPREVGESQKDQPVNLTSLRKRPPKYNSSGDRWCYGCSSYLPLTSFTRRSQSPDSLETRCKFCARTAHLMKRYKLSSEKFEEMLDKQSRACAICATEEPGVMGWQVDHDHSCCPKKGWSCGKCVRQVLCQRCNTGLGYFLDNKELLISAAKYLESHGKVSGTTPGDS